MTNSIHISLDNTALTQRISQIMRVLDNSQPMMAAIANELAAQTELAFIDEGPGWQQLRPSTVKRRKGGAHPILQVSNALARSITTQSGQDFAIIGTNVPYAAIHQFGGRIQREAKQGTVRLRTDAKGRLLRQKGHSNLAVFAKRSHKRATEREYNAQAYSIDIPARPFLPVTPDGQLKPRALDAVMTVLSQFLN
ncbi:phage virion morphogenesis protein [Pseudomonas sp. F1_0610]|uniref:phage virion morphogenesis protein n=1 Tax=Pseudomonas sp. F1_0610 TaxID=3114284 RepID=UPI0039C0B07E